MMFYHSVLAALQLLVSVAAAKNVFAHIVVGNTAAHDQAMWLVDISLAKGVGIDAFVLNIAYPDPNIPKQVANAFAAAEAAGSGFKLLLAFDYLGGGQPWPSTGDQSVVSYLNKYKASPAYFKVNGAPFVSTFEGVTATSQWAPGGPIRSAVGNVFFVPDWSSLGPGGIGAQAANIQGAFSWDMWPNGATNMTTATDKAWQSALKGIGSKPYMMGVSPWFFHSPPVAWVWRGDDLWADRWAQVQELQPEFVQIVTWNDFGEASYIGPIHATSEIPAAAQKHVLDHPHDAWRSFLPYYIAKYKGTPYTVAKDTMQYWYRLSAAGDPCGVTGNSAGNGQQTLPPGDVMQDGVYFSALLTSPATVQVRIGGVVAGSFPGSAGINHWSLPILGRTGVVKFEVLRGGAVVGGAEGAAIGGIGSQVNSLAQGCANYNAWVGGF